MLWGLHSVKCCDEQIELREGLGRWVRIIAVVTGVVRIVRNYGRVQFSPLGMALSAGRFAHRAISPENSL